MTPDPISVLWMPIPAGLRGPGARPMLSILVAPRLRSADGTDALLSAFAPFVDWPATVKALLPAMHVQFAGGAELPVTALDAGVLEPRLWQAVFPADRTAVRAFVPDDYANHALLSYGVGEGQRALGALYGATAAQHAGGPPIARHNDFARLVHEIAGERAHESLVQSLDRALAFHRNIPAAQAGEPWPEPADLAHLLDFHALVSSLGDHPALLRALGLIIDVVLPDAAPRGFAPTLLCVRPHFRASDLCPRVLAELDPVRFVAVPHESGRWGGLLPLASERYTLVQVDVDGALLKLDGLRKVLGERARLPAPDASLTAALPALRSGGLSIVHDNRAGDLAAWLARADQAEQGLAAGTATLTAEQLIRGYVVDIWDERKRRWRSLCARYGTYAFAHDPALDRTVHDEGFVQLAVTAHQPAAGKPILRLHESVARWDGWSLAAPRPGKALSHEADPAAPPELPRNDPLTSAGIAIDWKVEPGTLPTLRFGHGYRVRARALDLAGHVVALDAAPDDEAQPAGRGLLVYRRFEPVPAPVFVLRKALDPVANAGEASDRIVVRTENAGAAQDAAAGVAGGERQLVPPRASVALAEAHGALDDAAGLPRADLYGALRDRDGATLTEDPAQKVVIVAADRIVVPYLPDPLARGVALRDLPGTPAGTATLLPFVFKDEWPAAVGLRLALEDGDGPPRWDAAARVLTVQLAKGAVAKVPVSCWITEDDLELMAVWSWLRDWVDDLRTSDPARLLLLSGELDEAARRALQGGHWMLTPPHELVLVSAVRQPLGHPRFAQLHADRGAGTTATRFTGALAISGKSTSRIELLASWTEPVDLDDGKPPDLAVAHEALADELLVNQLPAGGDAIVLRTGNRPVGLYRTDEDLVRFTGESSPRHEFHDTRHRMVRYRARATTRFREYFPPDDAGSFTRTGEEIVVDVPASTRPAAPRPLYAVPTFGWERQTRTGIRMSRRRGGGLRIYLARPWFSSGEDERLAVVVHSRVLDQRARRELRHHITEWGRDPIVDGTRLAAEPLMQFPAALELAGPLTLPELGDAHPVHAATHRVGFDAVRDVWFCDVEIDPGTTYRPFVHLALARCQRHAVAGAELSPVVLLEFAQLAPDRALIVTHAPDVPGRHHVTVSGFSYRGTAAARDTGSSVEVLLQERQPGLPDELAWITVPGAASPDDTGLDTRLLWRGWVDVPTDPARGPFRVAVHEYETWPADVLVHDRPLNRRTVYFDTLELTR
jgi:hypothetical protein